MLVVADLYHFNKEQDQELDPPQKERFDQDLHESKRVDLDLYQSVRVDRHWSEQLCCSL